MAILELEEMENGAMDGSEVVKDDRADLAPVKAVKATADLWQTQRPRLRQGTDAIGGGTDGVGKGGESRLLPETVFRDQVDDGESVRFALEYGRANDGGRDIGQVGESSPDSSGEAPAHLEVARDAVQEDIAGGQTLEKAGGRERSNAANGCRRRIRGRRSDYQSAGRGRRGNHRRDRRRRR